jgi:membrane protease YdiL (CAAX protease family)
MHYTSVAQMTDTLETFRQTVLRTASPFGRFLLGVLVFFASDYIVEGFAPGSPNSLHYDIVTRPLLMLLLLAGFSVLLVTVDKVHGNPLVFLGLAVGGRWLRDIGWGLLLGTGMVSTAVLANVLDGTIKVKTLLSWHNAEAAAGVLFILASGAMAEELLFRGYPFQRLVEGFGPVAAVVILSALFGMAHLSNPSVNVWGVINTILVGVLLAIAYLRTRALWMPWGIHFAWNAVLGLGFGLPVSGLTKFSVLIRSRAQGPVWLTGGNYGIEASATGASVILVGIALLLAFVRQRDPIPPAKEESVILGLGDRN